MSVTSIGSEAKNRLKEVINDLFTSDVDAKFNELEKSLQEIKSASRSINNIRSDIKNDLISDESGSFIDKLNTLLASEEEESDSLINKLKILITSDNPESLKTNISNKLKDAESSLADHLKVIQNETGKISSITAACDNLSASINDSINSELSTLRKTHSEKLGEMKQAMGVSLENIGIELKTFIGNVEGKTDFLKKDLQEMKENSLKDISSKVDRTITDMHNLLSFFQLINEKVEKIHSEIDKMSKGVLLSKRNYYVTFILIIISFSNLALILYLIWGR